MGKETREKMRKGSGKKKRTKKGKGNEYDRREGQRERRGAKGKAKGRKMREGQWKGEGNSAKSANPTNPSPRLEEKGKPGAESELERETRR